MHIGDIVTNNITKLQYTITNIQGDNVRVVSNENNDQAVNDHFVFNKSELTLNPECVAERKIPDGAITEEQLRLLVSKILNMKDFEIKTTLYESLYYGWRGYQVINNAFNISFSFDLWNHLLSCNLEGFEISRSYKQSKPTLENVGEILYAFKRDLDKIINDRKKSISILCD